METDSHTQTSQPDSEHFDHESNHPQTPVEPSRSTSPEGQNDSVVRESQENAPDEEVSAIRSETLEARNLSARNKTLVDTVTDKIRGESMSLPPDSPAKVSESAAPESSNSHSGSDGDSSDKELSRKRKLSSHSSVANEPALRQHSKRPKESDVLEKEEDTEDSVATFPTDGSVDKPLQVFGFGSFASAKSPFASGQNPSVNATTNVTPASDGSPVTPNSSFKTPVLQDPPPSVALANAQASQPLQQPNGFAAFSSSSPFKRSSITALPPSSTSAPEQRESLAGPVRRSKSPVGKHQAFGQYSAGMSRFGNLSSRKALQDEISDQSATISQPDTEQQPDFEDILKAKGEEAADHLPGKLEIQEVEHNTGEEDDLTVFQTRAKLYTQDETFAYKERGTGLLKVNVRRSDGEGARIVMRAEGVFRLLLNMPLYPGLICELGPDPKFIKVAEITTHERRLHAVKVGNAKLAQELYDQLIENTPSKTSGTESA